MKKSIQSLFALSAFAVAAVIAQAQPAPKIAVVDMAKLFDSHYKTEEHTSKIRADEQKAQEELGRLNSEGNSLVEKYKELDEQAKNPALTGDAKAKAQAEAQRLVEDIRRKQAEASGFLQNTRNALQQRVKNFQLLMIEEISKIAVEVAKRRGATLLIDKSGQTLIGVSNIIYADSSYDITDDVLKEINKDRPAASATPAPAAAPAASAPADASADGAKIMLPGAKK